MDNIYLLAANSFSTFFTFWTVTHYFRNQPFVMSQIALIRLSVWNQVFAALLLFLARG